MNSSVMATRIRWHLASASASLFLFAFLTGCADPPTQFWLLSVAAGPTESGSAILDSTLAVLEQRADLLNDRLRDSGASQRVRYVHATADGRIEIGVSGAHADELDLTTLLQNLEVHLQLLSESGALVGQPIVSNNDFKHMIPVRDADEVTIQFELTRAAASRLQSVTAEAAGSRLALVMAGEVIADPVIRDPVGRYGQIELPGVSVADRDRLILAVRSGMLPAPVVVDERTDTPVGR